MSEQDSPTLSVTEAGDLLRRSLTPQQQDTSYVTAAQQQLDSQHNARKAKLERYRLESSKTLSEYGQDAAGALTQGAVNLTQSAVTLADIFLGPSDVQREAEARLGLPVTKSIAEVTNIHEVAEQANEAIQISQFSDRGQFRHEQLRTAEAQRDAEKPERIRKLMEEDGYSENVATAIDTAEDIVEAVSNLSDNPTIIVDEAIKSIPSFLAAGAGAAVSKSIAKAAGQTTSGIGGAAAGIGASEGSSVAAGSEAKVLKMSEEELREGSEEYVELRDADISHEDARRIIATRARDDAFLVAAPIAAVVGKATGAAKFESEAVSGAAREVGSVVKKTAQDVATEATEEAIQGGTGALAENLAIRERADKDQALTEGVGRAIGSGAIVGGAVGGAVGVPRNITSSAAKVVETTQEQKATIAKAKEEGIQEVVQDPKQNINIKLAAIAERNAAEGVTEEEHKANVAEAFSQVRESMETLNELATQLETTSGKEGKALQKQHATLQAQQQKAMEQIKLIQAREKATVTSEDVEASIESGDTKTFLGSFRLSPESVNQEDVNAFKESNPDLDPEIVKELDAHIATEEAIKTMSEVSDNILNGSAKDRFLGIRNYQASINTALESDNLTEANAHLEQLTAFTTRHTEKANVFARAFEGDQQAIELAKTEYDTEILPRSRNPKFSKNLVENTRLESEALNAAVAQAQLRISNNDVLVTPAPTTEAERAIHEAELTTPVDEVQSTETVSDNLGTSGQVPTKVESPIEVLSTQSSKLPMRNLVKIHNRLKSIADNVPEDIGIDEDGYDAKRVDNLIKKAVSQAEKLGITESDDLNLLREGVESINEMIEAIDNIVAVNEPTQDQGSLFEGTPDEQLKKQEVFKATPETATTEPQVEPVTEVEPTTETQPTVEPVDTDAAPITEPVVTTPEKILNTTVEGTTLADKGFSTRVPTDEKASPAALTVEPNLMSDLKSSPDLALKYANKAKLEKDAEGKPTLSENQKTALRSMSTFDGNLKGSFQRLFRHNPKNAESDYMQFMVNEDGSLDENVQSAITMAAYEWVMTSAGNTVFNSFEDINSILGRRDDAYVSRDLAELMTEIGATENSITDSIGSSAVRALGIKVDETAPISSKSKLEQSLGAMGLTLLLDAGYVTTSTHNAQDINDLLDEDEKAAFGDYAKVNFYRASTVNVDGKTQIDGNVQEVIDSNKGTDGLFTELFGIQSGRTGPTAEPNKQVAKKMRKTNMDTPKEVIPIIKEHQARAHWISRGKTDAFLALDEDTQLRIAGYNFEPEKEHISKRKGIDAKNDAIRRELQYLRDANEEFGDNPMYFTHEMTVVNRLLLVSNTFNPQGSKVHRHFARQSSWNTEIDRDNQQQMREFFTAFGESIGKFKGTKIQTDSGTWDDYGPLIMEMVEDPDVITAAHAVLNNGDPELFLPYIKEGAYSYDGLYNLGKYYAALDAGSRTFESDLFREVDGVTNGVIIGTLNLNAGENHDDITTKLARGGLMSDGATKKFGPYRGNTNDSYVTIANAWRDKVENTLRSLTGTEHNRLREARKIFGKIERGDAKGGLIQTVYGAGEASIKAGAANAFIDRFYGHIEKATNAGDIVTLQKLQDSMNVIIPGSIDLSTNPLDQELSRADRKKLFEYIESTYGQSLVDTIDEQFGDFKEKGSKINQAMDIAFQAYMLMREAEIKKLGDNVTQQELDIIDNALKESMPIMHSYFSQKSGNINEGLFVGKYEFKRNESPEFKMDQRYSEKPRGGTKKSVSTQGRERVMVSPGASPAVLGVQSIDAATMLKHLEKYNSLNVYDAIIVGQMDTMKQARHINRKFLDVQRDFSIMQSAYESMTKSLDLLHTYDPALTKKIVLRNNEDLGNFVQDLNAQVNITNEAKAERIASFTLVSQYHVDGGETTYAGTEYSNAYLTAVKEVKDKGLKFKGSTAEGIDIDQFQSDVVREVSRMNATEVFESLGNIGPIKDSASHTEHLSNVMEDVVAKVLDPVTLHMENNNVGETRGMTNGVDMYIINQTTNHTPNVSAMTVNGIRMSSQEVYAHEMVHNITREGVDRRSAASARIFRLWKAAARIITVEDLMNPNMPDTPVEREAAQKRWDHIFKPRSNQDGSADFLHEFVAFAMTNERFRQKLNEFSPNVGAEFTSGNTLFENIAQIFSWIMDQWHKLTVAKGNPDITAQQQMDNLFRAISGVNQRHKNPIIAELEKTGELLTDKMNAGINVTAKMVTKAAKSKVFTESKTALVRFPARLTGLVAEGRAQALVDVVKDAHAEIATGKEGILGAIITELEGRTIDNGVFHDLNRLSNMTVDQQRNHIKTLVSELSEKLYEGHPDGLTSEQKVAITKVALMTDLSSLTNTRSMEELQNLLNSDSELNNEINQLEQQLQTFGSLGNFYTRMSENLGHFMVTGKALEAHTLMNAEQIAKVWVEGRPEPSWAAQAEPLIDQLASLYALKYTDRSYKTEFNNILATEMNHNNMKNGVTFTLSMNEHLKADAKQRLFVGHNAMIKGYQKETTNPHVAIEYGTLQDEQEMNRLGFFRDPNRGPLKRDQRDPNTTDLYMYVNRHGGMSRFAAGSISTTGKAAKGANTFTSRAQTGDPDPGVTGANDVQTMKVRKRQDIQQIFATRNRSNKRTDHAIPLLNHTGKVIGYRYTMDEHTKDTLLEKDNEFNSVLGSTAANIQDKVSSKEVNEKLVDAMKEQFDSDFATQANTFVEIGPSSPDKEFREMYYMLPDETRRYIKQKWGGDTMYVKRNNVNLIFGYRKFSITDVWHDDPSDLNGFQRAYIQAMDWIFQLWGGSAYSGLKSIENFWQEIIKDIKDIIVIKTGVVTAVNTLSNTISLRMLGVPMKDILRDQAEAFRGAVEYQRDNKELHELEAILANDQRPNRRSLDQQRVAVLKNQIKNNPVRELVESGVYQTIVEDIEQDKSQFTYKSKFQEKVGNLVDPIGDKIPESLSTVAKNVFMTHDSKTYKIFNQAATLSDFTARYALHKHYTTRSENRLSKDESIAKVVSIFIDYDLPTHKGIQYANDMGIMWFSKYNFRLQKILLETLKENPARVMMLLALQSMAGDVPSMYDNNAITHDMTNMFRNPMDNLDAVSQIAPINMGSEIF